MTNYGYNVYFAYNNVVRTFPITPGALTIKVGSNNKVVNLIDGGDVNILKSPSLMEISFDARFPMRQYPYAREFVSFNIYLETFKRLKEQKKSFRFIVARSTPNGTRTWDTNILVALEDFEVKESVDEGDDVIISFKLKQYKEYGVKLVKITNSKHSKPTTTSTSNTPRPADPEIPVQYYIKEKETLFSISKKVYGTGDHHRQLYQMNKPALEDVAKKNGYESSSNGQLIFTGTVIETPPIDKMTEALYYRTLANLAPAPGQSNK